MTQLHLQDMTIDTKYMYSDSEVVCGTPIYDSIRELVKPWSIDEFCSDDAQYAIVDTLAQDETGRILLIAKSDPNETTAWLVIYAPWMQATHQLEVYCENAEGNFFMTSVSKDNVVTVSSENLVPEAKP